MNEDEVRLVKQVLAEVAEIRAELARVKVELCDLDATVGALLELDPA